MSRRSLLIGGALAAAATASGIVLASRTPSRPVSWTFGSERLAAAVAAAGNDVYVVDRLGLLSALDPSSGAVRWTFEVPGIVPGSPLTLQAAANTCYVGTTAGLYALDAASGQLRWTSKVSLLRATDELLVCTAQGDVQGFDPISGAARWSFRLDWDEGTSDGTLAAVGLVHLRSKSRIFTLDAMTGALRWEQSRPGENFNWAASRAGLFYATSTSAVRLDAATGSSLWRRPLPAPTFDGQTPSVTCNDDSVFLSSPEGQEAWDARSAVQQWHVNQPGFDPSDRTRANWMISSSGRQISTSDTVILIEHEYRAAHRVSARSTRDGDTLWTAPIDGVDSGVIDLALGTDNLYVLPLTGSDASVVRAISLT